MLLLVLRLEREAADLRLQLADEVGHAGQVVARARQAAERLVLPDLEVLDAGGLLEELPPLLGAQREGGIDGPLPHDDQLVGAEASAGQQVDDVLAAGRAPR